MALARRAAALDPLSYIAHGNLALRCLNSDLLEEADAALDQAFKLNPRAGLLPAVLGTLRLEQGRLDEALAAFQRKASRHCACRESQWPCTRSGSSPSPKPR